jgi:hypothetical protein
MVPLPAWPNPNEYDGFLLKSNPYLTAKEGTRKEEAGDCPPIDESKRLRQGAIDLQPNSMFILQQHKHPAAVWFLYWRSSALSGLTTTPGN